MGPPSYIRSVVDRNVVMRRIPVYSGRIKLRVLTKMISHSRAKLEYNKRGSILQLYLSWILKRDIEL